MSSHKSFNPGFPVLIYEEGMELPKTGIYYLVSGNGLWLHKDTGLVKGFVPVDNISVLQDLQAETYTECQLPKLPADIVWQIKTFFKKVVAKHRSEACTVLYFNRNTQVFRLDIPEQKVSHGSVKYKKAAMALDEDYLCVGTIHSHCDFGAFHSGTDIGDEENFDGLHCTFGHNDQEEFTITASIVVNGHRTMVDPTSVLEGVEKIEEKPEETKTVLSSLTAFFPKDKEGRFRLIPVDEATEANLTAPMESWMAKVEPLYVGMGWTGGGWFGQEKLQAGDRVFWCGSSQSLRETHGEGPFEVDAINGEMVIIKTDKGLASINRRLFTKANSVI